MSSAFRRFRNSPVVQTRFLSRGFATAYPFGSSIHGALGLGFSTLNHEAMQACSSRPALSGVTSASCGWAHTVYHAYTDTSSPPSFHITGKPHEFTTILRMNRLPSVVSRALGWMQSKASSPSFPIPPDTGMPSTFMSSAPLPVSFPSISPTSTMASSAGLTAFVATDGFLYTFGVNNFGQCGVGTNTNNVWSPTRVLGLHTGNPPPIPDRALNPGKIDEMLEMGNEGSVTSLSLGLQHGACSDSLGNVYTWGKGERGQLGLWPEGCNSYHASKVRMQRGLGHGKEFPIVEVECGLNHTAALSEGRRDVYVWGKLMGRPEGHFSGDTGDKEGRSDDKEGKATDAFLPHKFTFEADVKAMKCSSHQTCVLLSDNTLWAKGVLKGGWGKTSYDFIKVAEFERGREVELYGGHSCIAVEEGAKAYYVEMHYMEEGWEEEWNEDWGEEEEPGRGAEEVVVNPHFRSVDFLPEEGLGGKIVGVETGWRHGLVLVDDQGVS